MGGSYLKYMSEGYWIYPDGRIVEVNDHYAYVKEHPEDFGFTEEEASSWNLGDAKQREDVLIEAMKRGFVRVRGHGKSGLSIQVWEATPKVRRNVYNFLMQAGWLDWPFKFYVLSEGFVGYVTPEDVKSGRYRFLKIARGEITSVDEIIEAWKAGVLVIKYLYLLNDKVGGFSLEYLAPDGSSLKIEGQDIPADKVIKIARETGNYVFLSGGEWFKIGKEGYGEAVSPEEAEVLIQRLQEKVLTEKAFDIENMILKLGDLALRLNKGGF